MIDLGSAHYVPAAYPLSAAATNAERTVNGMQAFVGFYLAGIGAALCIALVAAGVVYLLRPIMGWYIQSTTLAKWVSRGSKDLDLQFPGWLMDAASRNGLEHPEFLASKVRSRFVLGEEALAQPSGFVGLTTKPGQLRDELFMHSVQREARAAVARPSSNPWLFMAVTREATGDLRGAAALFDAIAREHPKVAAKLMAFENRPEGESVDASPVPNPTAAALQAAEATLQAAADQALDRLQLSLMSKAIWPYRTLALVIGAALAWFGMLALGLRNFWIYVPVGIAGGVLSLFLSDALAFITRRLAR